MKQDKRLEQVTLDSKVLKTKTKILIINKITKIHKFNQTNLPLEKTWAEVATLNIPSEIMEIKDPREYVEQLVAVNKIKPNHIPEVNPEATKKTKIAADMEKIASVIGIKKH